MNSSAPRRQWYRPAWPSQPGWPASSLQRTSVRVSCAVGDLWWGCETSTWSLGNTCPGASSLNLQRFTLWRLAFWTHKLILIILHALNWYQIKMKTIETMPFPSPYSIHHIADVEFSFPKCPWWIGARIPWDAILLGPVPFVFWCSAGLELSPVFLDPVHTRSQVLA